MKMLLAFLSVAFALSTFAQSALDAPAEKTITVGSEIARGGEAVLKSLGKESDLIGVSKFFSNMEEAVAENRQARSDSDGFMLGERLNQWRPLDFALNNTGLPTYNKPAEIAECQHAAPKYFGEMRELQKKLGIKDSDLFQALEIKDAAKLAKIEERLKAYEGLR